MQYLIISALIIPPIILFTIHMNFLNVNKILTIPKNIFIKMVCTFFKFQISEQLIPALNLFLYF